MLTPADFVAKGTKEDPLEVHNVVHPGLPVYGMEIGPPKTTLPMDVPVFIPVNTILDTGAESNYLTAQKASAAHTQVFPITAREIVGAGRTTTSAFASFTLKIGGMLTQCYAYVLEDATQFRYDLLLGRAWLKRHNTTPKWDDDAYEFLHPEEKTHFVIKPIFTKERPHVPKLLTKLAWRLRPKHQSPHRYEFLHHVQEMKEEWDDTSTKLNDGSNATLEVVKKTFGERVKKVVKETLPGAFKDKVGFPPL